jgi:O-antigen ligase
MRTDGLNLSSIQRRGAEPLIAAASVAFVLMFFAGDVKGNASFAWIPFDLTVGAGALAFVLSAFSFLPTNGRVRTQAGWMLSLFLVMSMAVTWTDWTSYAIQKAAVLFSLSFFAAMLPAFLFTRLENVKLFVFWIVVVGMLISASGLMQVFTGETVQGRITGINSNTISLGRNAGIALVGLYTIVSCGGRKRLWLAIFCLPLFMVLISSGSRGPVLIALIVIAFVTLRWALGSFQTMSIVLALFAAATFVIVLDPPFLPEGSVERIQRFVELRYDNSAEERVLAGRVAMREITQSPLGLGIGGFSRVYNFGNGTDRIYPHNLFLEITVEEGWIAGLLFLTVASVAGIRAYRSAAAEPELRPFFAVFVFAFCNALVSGDVNDNKILYSFLCIAILSPELVAQHLAVRLPYDDPESV